MDGFGMPFNILMNCPAHWNASALSHSSQFVGRIEKETICIIFCLDVAERHLQTMRTIIEWRKCLSVYGIDYALVDYRNVAQIANGVTVKQFGGERGFLLWFSRDDRREPRLRLVFADKLGLDDIIGFYDSLAQLDPSLSLERLETKKFMCLPTFQVTYLGAFSCEVSWILEAHGDLPIYAYLLCSGYFIMFVASTILIHGLATVSIHLRETQLNVTTFNDFPS